MHHVGYCHGDTPGDGSYTADDLILRAGQWLSLHEHLRGGGGGGGWLRSGHCVCVWVPALTLNWVLREQNDPICISLSSALKWNSPGP